MHIHSPIEHLLRGATAHCHVMLRLTHPTHAYRAINCFFVCENMSFSSTTGATYPSAYRSHPHTTPTSPRGTIVILSTGDAPSVSSDTIACPHSCSRV